MDEAEYNAQVAACLEELDSELADFDSRHGSEVVISALAIYVGSRIGLARIKGGLARESAEALVDLIQNMALRAQT